MQKLIVHRSDPLLGEGRCGEPKWIGNRRFLHCWFTYETFLSYATDKLMEKLVANKVVTKRRSNHTVLYERARYVYYEHESGMFYVPNSNKNEQRMGDAYLLVPFDGTIYSDFPMYQAKHGLVDAEIVCVAGYPVSLRIGHDAFSVSRESWPSMEGFLGLDEQWKPEKHRPNWATIFAERAAKLAGKVA